VRLPSSDIRRILAFALAAGLGLGVFIYGFVRLIAGAPPASIAEGLPGALLVGLLIGLALCACAKLALRQAAYDLHNYAVTLTETDLRAPVPITGDEVVYLRATLSQALAYVPRPGALPELARRVSAAPDDETALGAAAEHMAEHLPVQGAILFALDGERQVLTPLATWGTGHLARRPTLDMEETAIGRALAENRPATYSGLQLRAILPLERGHEAATLFFLPLLVRGQPFGTLCLIAEGAEVRLNDEQRAFAQSVADLLILGVQNSMQRRLLERETARLMAFEQLGGLLAGSPGFDQALEQVLRVAARVTDSEHGSLLLLEPDESRVRYRVTLRQGDVLPLSVTAGPILKHGLAGWALRERRADIVEDTERDARWLPVPGLDQMRAVLVVPLLYGERALGILTLADPTPRHYTRRSLALISALAAYAVTVLARDQHQALAAPGQGVIAQRVLDGHIDAADLELLRVDGPALERILSPQQHEAAALFIGVSGLERAECRLGAEALIGEVLTPFIAELSAVVHANHGYVAQQDEGALALFGYPDTNGDARLRAMRAAQAVQLVARRLRGRWRSQLGCDLAVSAGLAAGPIAAGLVGDGRFQEIALAGAPIREARRIQRLARADEILVADTLAEHLGESLFQLEPLPPLHPGAGTSPRTIYRLIAGRG
jgi:GAF domain-containing protein